MSLSDLLVGHKFYDWVTGVDGPVFIPTTAPAYARRCTDTLKCDQKKARTYISVSPAAEARNLNPQSVPGYGVVVALMVSDKKYGKFTEWKYKVPKGTDTVYIVVEPATGMGHWTAVQVNANESTPLAEGDYSDCPDHHDPDATSLAGFGGCPANMAAAKKASQDLSSLKVKDVTTNAVIQAQKAYKKAFPYDPYDDSPAWISCIYGCCVAY
jgi:hypothetical protein